MLLRRKTTYWSLMNSGNYMVASHVKPVFLFIILWWKTMVMIAAVANFFLKFVPSKKKNVYLCKQLFRESARDNPGRYCGWF